MTAPQYGPRYALNRSPRQYSPRIPSPRQQGLVRSPGVRHEPYPIGRPIRQPAPLNLDQTPGLQASANKDGQVIKVEAEDDNGSNQSSSDANAHTPGAGESGDTVTKSGDTNIKTESGTEKDEDNQSECSTGTVPNTTADPLSLDSDFSNLISGQEGNADRTEGGSESESNSGLDPNVSVKLEALTESEMELEITGVEPGRVQGPGLQDWAANMPPGMNFDPSGATGSSIDMMGSPQGYSKYIYLSLFL